ncbi:hypothetical protein M1446_03500 [Candidatus Dependentiae bacterium]|nr:hypothetical protein [Candidatus Dependentiae bacterium]
MKKITLLSMLLLTAIHVHGYLIKNDSAENITININESCYELEPGESLEITEFNNLDIIYRDHKVITDLFSSISFLGEEFKNLDKIDYVIFNFDSLPIN